ncbi:4Fe-4S dicluster domain-containing protein [Sulfurospirillum arcachonense]|uniref:4Fe-4S dicluster domain-containing protein n=1 Tax=Sulfurospirillum arcachonense TaxID=57666 RepID=UPI000469CFED|nr:4Fe-4S dicluster domain-containing protein [Sulfurospirillum arcachonense]
MAVMITDLCINCDSCVDECPATAIVGADDSPLENAEFTYVKPEKCIECVDSSVPKCFDACPTEGAIVWDMPYTAEFNTYYMDGNDNGTYKIRIHKKKGIFSPEAQPRPFRDTIDMNDRASHTPLDF